MSTPILPEQPPYNEDAEESVLGAALMDPAALAGIRDCLSPQDFHVSAAAGSSDGEDHLKFAIAV